MELGTLLRRRVAPAILLAGLAGSVAYFSRSRPIETTVTLRLDGDRTQLIALECSFESANDNEVTGGASFHFTPSAPPFVRTTARASAGDYDAVISLELASGARPNMRRRVHLGGDPLTIRVPIDQPLFQWARDVTASQVRKATLAFLMVFSLERSGVQRLTLGPSPSGVASYLTCRTDQIPDVLIPQPAVRLP